ncbi:MAG: PEGA domain-containing protein [Polyangiaceae bacterium]
MSKSPGAVPPPPSLRQGQKSTLLGLPAPLPPPSGPVPASGPVSSGAAPPPPPPGAVPPPSLKPQIKTTMGMGALPPPAAPPTSVRAGSSPALPPPVPPPKTSGSAPPTSGPSSMRSPSAPPVPPAKNTLVAAVPPPPKPASSIGAQVGMPSAEEPEEKTPPAGTAVPSKKKASGASVEMDWEDEEESTHVFEKKRHGPKPRPAAGDGAKPSAAAALAASSGSSAAPRSVPPPPVAPAIPTKTVPLGPLVEPSVVVAPATPTATPLPAPIRRPSDEPTIVRPRDSGSKAGIILGGLALVAVVGLGVYMFLPRSGALQVDVVASNGGPLAKADIFVDGQKRCETAPCRVTDVPTGRRVVKVVVGDKIMQKEIDVEAGREGHVDFSVDLRPAPINTNKSTTTAPPIASTSTPAPVVEGTGFKLSGTEGVKVLVDGKERATLSGNPAVATFTDLTPGAHKLKLDGGDRYEALERDVTVTKNKVDDLGELKLKVLKGRLILELKTSGADVILSGMKDGKKVEKRLDADMWKNPPIKLDLDPKGEWKLAAKKKGFQDYALDVVFEDGAAEKNVAIELLEEGKTPPPLPSTTAPPKTSASAPTASASASVAPSGQGTIKINSRPVTKVLLDGKPIGSTPQVVQVAPGKHTVTFIHPDKRKQVVPVDVQPGKSVSASAKFD